MKRVLALFIFTMLFTLTSISAQIIEQNESLIPKIRDGKLDLELVTIEGIVEHWEKVPQQTTIRYWIRNNWGDIVPVQSIKNEPTVNEKYRITGTVQIFRRKISYNKNATTRFINEHARYSLGVPPPPPPKSKEIAHALLISTDSVITANSGSIWFNYDDASKKYQEAKNTYDNSQFEQAILEAKDAKTLSENPSFSTLFYLIILLILLAIAVVVVLSLIFFKKSSTPNRDFGRAPQPIPNNAPDPAPAQVIGETIKLNVPPPGTLKVLPGRLEILNGENHIKEIRFYTHPSEKSFEFSFGRSTGTPYKHIQIDHQAVSRDQARLFYSNGTYTIINKADPQTKNATKVNDQEMSLNQTIPLNDGDKITMGIIELIYHKN